MARFRAKITAYCHKWIEFEADNPHVAERLFYQGKLDYNGWQDEWMFDEFTEDGFVEVEDD